MAYTTIDDPSAYFQTKLYTGTGSSNAITGVGFQPDFCWIKNRGTATAARVFDSVRGATKVLYTSETDAEGTNAQSLKSFDSDGFTMGTHATLNASSNNIVSWNWKAGTSFTNDASSTSVGSIDSAGSVNTTSGFSIITYTGTGSAATVAHGLGVAPKLIINRTISAAKEWDVYYGDPTDYLVLNTTAATADASDKWNDTAPTSTVWSIESSSQNNTSGGTCLAYCFAEKKGFSKIGSYTGNGNADGNFIYLGFKPAFILLKGTANTENWSIYDNKRLGYNVDNNVLASNSSAAELTDDNIDLLSNGFKIRRQTGLLNDAQNYIFMAFAEQPLVTSTGVPATAR
jgi:hypothetical protein